MEEYKQEVQVVGALFPVQVLLMVGGLQDSGVTEQWLIT